MIHTGRHDRHLRAAIKGNSTQSNVDVDLDIKDYVII